MNRAEQKYRLGAVTTGELGALIELPTPLVALVPVGAVEPHGPHLALETDTVISEACAFRAAALLEQAGVNALVAPGVSYGVTNFASGFAGAVSVDGEALSAYLRSVVEGLVATGITHVCLVNNHLEPGHDRAVRASIAGLEKGRASVASPLTRRWARTLSDEFKSGAAHGGEYETSIVMATRPELVREDVRRTLPEVPVSLSEKIAEGMDDFVAMGLEQSYCGSPARASAAHGTDMIKRLAEMVATEVCEAIGVDRRSAR